MVRISVLAGTISLATCYLLLAPAPQAQADDFTLHATVAAQPSDFQLGITSDQPPIVGDNITLTYDITYGWLPSYPTDIIVIQANWAAAAGQPLSVDYISGSATQADGTVSPVVDLSQRTITWSISPAPSGGNRHVQFSLRTSDWPTSHPPADFLVSARIIGPGISLPWQTVTTTYQPGYTPSSPTPTPSPTSIEQAATPSASLTVTPPSPTAAAGQSGNSNNQTPPARTFQSLKNIPVVGPALQQTAQAIDKIAHKSAAAAAVPIAAVAAIPWLLTIIPTLLALLPNLSWWQLLSLLGMIFWRQTRRPWGVVYDSRTKLPLDPVLITLTDTNGKIFQTVSDIYGRYQFVVEPGQYWLKAQKSNYTFPSAALKDRQADEIYQDLYFGAPIVVSDGGAISYNIPMDPLNMDWNEVDKQRLGLSRQTKLTRISLYGFGAGFAWSGLMAAFAPNIINLAIAGLYALMAIGMFWYRQQHPWGVIRDARHQPLAGAVVTLNDVSNPLIHRPPIVTTAAGRYAFLVDKGKYQLSIARRRDGGEVWPVAASPVINQTKPQGHIARNITVPSQ